MDTLALTQLVSLGISLLFQALKDWIRIPDAAVPWVAVLLTALGAGLTSWGQGVHSAGGLAAYAGAGTGTAIAFHNRFMQDSKTLGRVVAAVSGALLKPTAPPAP